MHFHMCGNWLHDIFHNTLVLLSMAPDWVPMLRGWSLSHLARLPAHKHEEVSPCHE